MHVGSRHLRLQRRRPVPSGVGEADAERSCHQTSRTNVKVAWSVPAVFGRNPPGGGTQEDRLMIGHLRRRDNAASLYSGAP